MIDTFDEVLSDDLITAIHRNDSRGLFVIRIGEIQTQIEIALSRYMDHERTTYWLMHANETPLQSFAFRTSRPERGSPVLALLQATSDFTQWYRDAVEEGQRPNDDWLEAY
jgi:hypothetical protein